ncbi:hypothetical protein KC921_02160 [Candidatus Woesebacteria bacterium]|nr:hypothetical protein [Candidatus Woesebacteria bacterium]
MQHLLDPILTKMYQQDKKWLEEAEIPIVTVSGTMREDIKGWHGLTENETITDVVLSRAHFSMALAVATQAWDGKLDHKKAWLVDPTNYVSQDKWQSIKLTEAIGKTLARNPMLKMVKDVIDTFGRQKLPILDSITPPLLYLTENITKPILSLHVAAGNILLEHGKTVLQVITDPHVRYDYLTQIESPNLTFAVFDQNTKDDLLEKVALLGKKFDPKRVVVTGPPIDPRVLHARAQKNPWKSGPINLCLTTGGLGTNKPEILEILKQLLPELSKKDSKFKLLIYCGTQEDLYKDCLLLAKLHSLEPSRLENTKSHLRIIYHPQIVDANEQLITYGFPWADGFISKPSGDMAYDAVASGSFLLTLQEWGEWEGVIRQHFENLGMARVAITENILAQLASLSQKQDESTSWIRRAMTAAQKLPAAKASGTEAIIAEYQKLL